ncbi:hypothetical protein F5144DRAFT_586659 [Chaetomium tenue]|uniref:Uncharacterized protein n=1 Tax=Chaetomium tenue TaxID=1854479 RepID=A0ACB7NZ70_9PEZI|nr:hypothetical protein F5144DRAFT_586659 [Chaetomium globosum]
MRGARSRRRRMRLRRCSWVMSSCCWGERLVPPGTVGAAARAAWRMSARRSARVVAQVWRRVVMVWTWVKKKSAQRLATLGRALLDKKQRRRGIFQEIAQVTQVCWQLSGVHYSAGSALLLFLLLETETERRMRLPKTASKPLSGRNTIANSDDVGKNTSVIPAWSTGASSPDNAVFCCFDKNGVSPRDNEPT